MNKNLQIRISAEGQQGRIDIIGSISEWNQNNAMDLRARSQELKDGGATAAHVYLMTIGGDCFQANEIVNILKEIFGGYTGEGGAIVASAGTYIAVNASSFSMAKNGQFMIHKPSGGAYGNEQEIENYLTLMKNMTTTYYDSYKVKLKKPENDFKAKWDGGDFWMTAQEAKDWGFVTDVKEPVKVDQATASAIKASGSPIEVTDIITNENNPIEMSIQSMALTLGLAATANEEQITVKLSEVVAKAGKYDALKAEVAQKEKAEKDAKIKAALDKAVTEKRITAEARPDWQAALDANFDNASKLLDAIQPVAKVVVKPGSANSGEVVNGKLNGKTLEQLQEEDPQMLAELAENDPESYEALHADWRKRKNIKN